MIALFFLFLTLSISPFKSKSRLGLLGRARAIEQAYGLGVQVTQLIGLQPVGQDAKQQMAGQVRGRLPPEHGVPTAAKLTDAEIAQARNLGVE